ncbi:MAG: hypothetical protein CML66_13400 [Rhodobacteraceae bacterium]|nr:hypothetical protein [Paracoccaceae bacterium]
MRILLARWLAGVLLALALVGPALAQSPESTLNALLGEVRAGMPANCDAPEADALVRVLCSGHLRVGVRDSYPLFATVQDGERHGYDIDVARAIAQRLGVEPVWIPVKPATRISTLAEGGADVVIATMGHNTRRDAEATFIRPHYYQSETTIVGPKSIQIHSWDDLFNRTVCTTIGNYANARIVSRDVRVMLYDAAGRLPEALRDGTCRLAAQDDSFFAAYLAQDGFGDQFERKFGFDQVPWGMAVAADGADGLAQALGLVSLIMHRDGGFLEIAQRDGIFTEFLQSQQALFNNPECIGAAGFAAPDCLIPALEADPPPTAFLPQVEAFLAWTKDTFGVSPALPMLMTQPAWDLFIAGVVNSLILVAGALAATLAFALFVGFISALPYRPVRFLAWLVVVTLQSSPVLLTLVVVTAVAQALFTYSSAVALGAAIVALGLMNGCNAGQAIGEAAESIRRERGLGRGLTMPLFGAAVSRSLTQLLSFLVNAAKGTPVASFTGAPELLAALTDITSFAAGRVATYTIVLVFYMIVVWFVVWVCNRVRARIERTGAGA